jgi:hypothetical protein
VQINVGVVGGRIAVSGMTKVNTGIITIKSVRIVATS